MLRVSLLLSAVAAVLAGLAASAHAAAVIELGATSDAPSVSCPEHNCTAVGRVTGYQVRHGGGGRNPFRAKRSGKVVALSLRLGKPNESQLAFFTERFGRKPTARLSVLKPGRRRSHRLVAQSEVFNLTRYLGSEPTFALRRPLAVAKGNVVALTVPTWAPAFSVGLGGDDVWRASRRAGRCGGDHLFRRAAQQKVGSAKPYACVYRGARLSYTATFIPNPEPAS